jgi:hypothetical protein
MIFVYRICQLLLSAANLVNLIYDIYITVQPCNTLTHSTNEDLLNIKYAINSVILFLSSMFNPLPFIQAMIFVYRICQLLLSAANLVKLIYDIYITDEFVTHIFIGYWESVLTLSFIGMFFCEHLMLRISSAPAVVYVPSPTWFIRGVVVFNATFMINISNKPVIGYI